MCRCNICNYYFDTEGRMSQNEKNREFYTIDLMHIFSTLWKKIWAIILCGVIGATVAFSYATFIINPTYSSEIMLYVNNSSLSVGGASFSISSSEITAAQSLVKTYSEMLKNRTTLEAVIEKSGVNFTWKELNSMIETEAVNDTEILRVRVICEDPYDAAKIANCIAEVLPKRISEIIEGSSMEVVDSAVVNLNKVAPSITKFTAIGAILGVLISAVVVMIIAMLDDTIHDEEYILQNYKYPILAKVPDLHIADSKGYAYYKKSSR